MGSVGMVSRSDVCLSSVHLVFGNWGRRLGFPHLHVLHGYHDFGRVGPWRRPGSLFPPEARQHGTGVVPARERVRAVHGAVDALHHDRREHKKTHEAEYVELHGGGTTDLPRRQPTDASLQRCCLEFTPAPTDGSTTHVRGPTGASNENRRRFNALAYTDERFTRHVLADVRRFPKALRHQLYRQHATDTNTPCSNNASRPQRRRH